MFDWKVLIAVFITLWGIAIGMAQGSINISDISTSNFKTGGWSVTDLFGAFSPDSEIPISALFTTDEFPVRTKIFSTPVSEIKLTYNPRVSSVEVRGSEVFTNASSLTLHILDFKGLFTFGEVLSINGYAGELKFGDVSLKNAKLFSKELIPKKLEINGFPKTGFSFDSVNGQVNSSGARIFLEDKPLSIKDFEGSAVFLFENKTYSFVGDVSKLLIEGTPLIKFTK